MSDVEENNFEGRESRSQSKSPAGSPARVKSESRSGSRSPSRASKHSESHSRSRSKSRSRSRRHSHRRYTRSRSHSHSHRRRSRSRSYTPEYRRRRSRSHSPMSNRRRHTGSRANPDPNTCLGVFGLSLYTTERDLREVFSRYGPLTGVNVVYDQRTGRSRGFAFVYFERIDDSKEQSLPNNVNLSTLLRRPEMCTLRVVQGIWKHLGRNFQLLITECDGACKWNGAGWQEDSSGLLNHQESTYTHPRHLHGQANTQWRRWWWWSGSSPGLIL
uniref:Transformer-2 protein homolog beta n=1 Tax=Corvus moneduloides TaxID=1196302 RepID=A0A8C3EBR3_CORMO